MRRLSSYSDGRRRPITGNWYRVGFRLRATASDTISTVISRLAGPRVTQQRTFRALVLTLHRCSGALKELALRRMQQPVNCSLPINTYIRAQHRTHVSCSLIGRHYDADTFPARSPLFPISDKTRKVVGVDSPLSHDVTQRSIHRNSSLVAFTTFEMISAVIYYPAAAASRS